jgi:hypothetical protein
VASGWWSPDLFQDERNFSIFSGFAQSGITLPEQIGLPRIIEQGGRMLFTRRTSVLLVLAGLVTGCATGALSPREVSRRASLDEVVTAKELGGIGQQGSLMDALARVRPGWLNSRGATTGVSVDGSRPSELAYLRTIPASDVLEVRLERSSSSVGRVNIAPNGDVIVGNVIIVMTRR